MPRTYVRKTQRQSWTGEQLKCALKAIKDGCPIRRAGKEYGVPESTLRDKMKVEDGGTLNPSLGRKPTFDKNQKEEIAAHVMKLADMFYGLTPIELRRVAFEFAVKNNLKHSFYTENKLTGKDWLYLFTKRNPGVSLREPDNTSINRIQAFNKEEVTLFYNNLQSVYEKHPFQPHRIYNQDETGISNVQKKSCKVYAKRGQKRVGAATSAERGKNITVVCCFNAAGGYVPPMVIYPRKRMAAHLRHDGPVGAVYHCSHNGWSNEDLYIVWLNHFKENVKPTKEDPVFLICDNHGSHISLEAYNFCRENHITVVSIPPHTSHRLQPLDVTFFSPLKGAQSREFGLFMVRNAHKKVTIADVAGLLNKAYYVKVATMDKGISSFRSAGICPLNPDKFYDKDFAPAEEFKELEVLDDTNTEQGRPTNDKTKGSDSQTTAENKEREAHRLVTFADVSPIPKNNTLNKKNKKYQKQHSQILTSTSVKIVLETKKQEKEAKEKKKL